MLEPGDVGDTGAIQISSDHPSMVPESPNAEQQTPCNSSAKEKTSAMEIS